MPHTNAWSNTTPLGSEFASNIDNHMRTMKTDVDERMSICFVWGDDQTFDGYPKTFPFRAADNTSLFSISAGNSLTGANAQPMFDMSQTWNTTGTPTAFKLNITDTASNAAALLFDFQVGGASKGKLSKAGALTITGGITAGSGTVGIVDSTGKIPAITSTYFASLDGANLTNVVPVGAALLAAASNTFTGGPIILSHSTGTFRERGRATPMGEWIDFNPNYTTNTGTWTVELADQNYMRYMLIGKTMFINFRIDSTTLSAVGTQLRISLPAGFTGIGAGRTIGAVSLVGGGINETGHCTLGQATVDADSIFIYRASESSAHPDATNAYFVRGSIAFEVQ